ncbi:M48 family metallopeptidase [Alishewanella tabrizica]|uniref:YgjP-like metallopeptidase domain-containing protein n=1 Tax=Alishewanella tabrizica TaxID=671278 RepID=A0ABQ2WSF2_9ALTE|nr:SprT family zinc-dependent metalloprotease [Alishewanella tabrizica]GGW68165.1 hypothetical protein GCM10008111_25350 [Alishewanella tabrizica]
MTDAVANTLPFQYELIFSTRRRSIQLAIVQGQLKVRAPTGTSSQYIKRLLEEKQAWVLKHLQSGRSQPVLSWLERSSILVNGKRLAFNWTLATGGTVLLSKQALQLTIPSRIAVIQRERYIQRELQRFFTLQAQNVLATVVEQQSIRMGVFPSSIRIGNWKRRWGYCDSQGVLGFNWRLMQAPDWVLEYVVIHELAHLQYLNHSAHFWQLVSQFYSDVAAAQSWLKQHQHELM